jgi:hypothetical protein
VSVDSKTDLLTTQKNEFIKSYVELDVTSRPLRIYTAPTDALHGAVCSVVQYEYFAPNSTIVIKMKEFRGTWDSSYDI